MTDMPLSPGDEIDVVVTTVAPFGVLVRTDAGLDGLVRGGRASLGSAMRVRVLEVDAEQQRFSAEMM
jgi:ribosomal protein S1